ncbi:spore cortex protein yabq (spore yabq) [Lucifera butyrica]|uniref:Spore cortex protein yabq (Spore yabq) n=1 Tax=Lucifera butyrica TaxID=1351585 RepID=A0A498R4N2_9FIRM|nr:spore cortex protein yabq (spore yabq) [Lucifera butyrica]
MGFSGQAETFFFVLWLGIVLGILFDFYRVLRGIFRPRWIMGTLADLGYWVLAIVVVFGSLLAENWGEVRGYTFLGLIAGIGVYYRLFSHYVLRLLIRFFQCLALLGRWLRTAVLYGFIKPVCFSGRLLAAPWLFAGRTIRHYYQKHKKPPTA